MARLLLPNSSVDQARHVTVVAGGLSVVSQRVGLAPPPAARSLVELPCRADVELAPASALPIGVRSPVCRHQTRLALDHAVT
jgi:hypothetical protein